MIKRTPTRAIVIASALMLAACGGGGGSSPTIAGPSPTTPAPAPAPAPVPAPSPAPSPSPVPAPLPAPVPVPAPLPAPAPVDPINPAPAPGLAPTSYTVKGDIRFAETASIDSDTNDPNATYRSNDSFDSAQSIPNPTLLVGHLTLRGEGPLGPNRTVGDEVDYYKVRLQAGQVIELQFSAKPSDIDIDLFVYDSTRRLVAQSTGENSYECVRIRTTGDYFIAAEIYVPSSSGDTVYQMRISAPSASPTCSNVTTNALSAVIAGEVIAEPIAAPQNQLAPKATRKFNPVALAGIAAANRPALFEVPRSLDTFRRDISAVTKSIRVKSASPTGVSPYSSLNDATITAESQRVLETIAYAKAMKRSGDWAYAFANFTVQSSQYIGPLPANDREYLRQRWHYEQISLPLAMSTLTNLLPAPTRRPIVAVVDTGIVINHPDLAANLVGGYDFVKNAAVSGDGDGIDANPDDSSRASTNPSFHGTHVAGTVAAIGNNTIGGIGVAPMALIMPLRALGEGGSGTFYDILQAMNFAARLPNDSGTLPPVRADVLNLSLGGSGACDPQIVAIIDRIRAQGTIVVAATGNDSETNSVVPVGNPANCSGVIAVGATNALRTRAFYSNGGPEISLVAPGGDTSQSTTGTGNPDSIHSTIAAFQNGVRVPSYGGLMGTSMATPHAAGIFALMRWANPNITEAQVQSLLAAGSLTEDLGAPGRDNLYGMGLISAKKAVDAAIASLGAPGGGGTAPPALPQVGRVEPSPANISFGTTRTEVEFVLRRVGASSETVTSVVSGTNGITVIPKAGSVDANRLGTYIVIADRSIVFSGAGVSTASFGQINVTMSTGRVVALPVDIANRISASSTGSYGPIYVLIVDADDTDLRAVAQAVVREPVSGVYSYSVLVNNSFLKPSKAPSRFIVFAGADTDNDNSICNRGEACGAFPVLGNTPTIIEPRVPTISAIDFFVSPYGGITAASINSGRLGTAGQPGGLRRLNSNTDDTASEAKNKTKQGTPK